jgi:hypothetical protein
MRRDVWHLPRAAVAPKGRPRRPRGHVSVLRVPDKVQGQEATGEAHEDRAQSKQECVWLGS